MSAPPGARSLRFAVPERHRFRDLQALEDAINYRLARLMAPCLKCELDARGRCDEHACDVALIAGYLEAAHTTMGELSRATERMRQDEDPSSPGSSGGHGA